MPREGRRCNRCKKYKDVEEFAWAKKQKGKRSPRCRVCQSEMSKKHYRSSTTYREANRERLKKARLRNKDYVREYLENHPCVDCGNNDVRVLEFDHVRGDKKANISHMTRSAYAITTLREEIDKCDVRCANCHRIKTYIENGY